MHKYKYLLGLAVVCLGSIHLNAAQGRGFKLVPTDHQVADEARVFFVTNGALGASVNGTGQGESKINQAVQHLVGALVGAYFNPNANPKPLALLVNEGTGEILSAWPNIKDGHNFAKLAVHRAVVDAIKASENSEVASSGYSSLSRRLETINYKDAIDRIEKRAKELNLQSL